MSDPALRKAEERLRKLREKSSSQVATEPPPVRSTKPQTVPAKTSPAASVPAAARTESKAKVTKEKAKPVAAAPSKHVDDSSSSSSSREEDKERDHKKRIADKLESIEEVQNALEEVCLASAIALSTHRRPRLVSPAAT